MTRTLRSRLKRQQERRQAMFLVLGCALVVGAVLLVFELTAPSYMEESGTPGAYGEIAGEFAETSRREETRLSVNGELPLSLGLGGDVSFGLDVADMVAREGPAYPWTEMTSLFLEHDFVTVNLEGPLCRGGEPNPDQKSVYLKGDASSAASMAAAGIDAVSLANDHVMDYGPSGLEETLNTLRAEKIGAYGAGPDRRTAEQPLVLKADNGANLSLLSFCDVAPPSFAAGEDSPGVSSASLERIDEKVRGAAEESPYVVVFMHWGEAGSGEITPRQRELARACVQAGADLVVGCHPRVVQGMEVIGGVPVLYSLGNLVFSTGSEEEKNAVFAGCRFADGRLTSLEVVPLRVEDARPMRLAGEQAREALLRFQAASLGVDMDISSESAIVRPQ